MGISPLTTLSAALLLTGSAAAMAQDSNEQPRPESSTGVERVEGVPDNFSLQPGPEAVRNRMEPMVQPLPTPTATPTPRATPAPQVTPEATPTPTITALPEPEARRTDVPRETPPAVSVEEVSPAPEVNLSDTSDEPRAEELPAETTPQSPAPRVTEQGVSEDEETSGLGWLAWLLGGAILFCGIVVAALWWRNRAGESFVVEKIEPYRPPPTPPSEEQPAAQEVHTPPPAKPQSAGYVHASRPAPVSNPGGFVTSTMNTRPRGNTTSDGRVVTSLSRDPSRRN